MLLSDVEQQPPIIMNQKGLCVLMICVLMDPTLEAQVCKHDGSMQSSTLTMGMTNQIWCLPFTMMALQQPLYNLICITLQHASLHVPQSPFYASLCLWLLWLEPWNATAPGGAYDMKTCNLTISLYVCVCVSLTCYFLVFMLIPTNML